MAFCELPNPEEFPKLTEKQLEELDNYKEPTRKILELTNVLELTQKDYFDRRVIYEDIFKILKEYYPKCELCIFGSSINGLGCRGCDLDLLFLPFPEYSSTDFIGVAEDKPTLHPSVFVKHPKLKKTLPYRSDLCHLKFLRNLFHKNHHIFRDIFLIPAKIPILNIRFQKFDFECDLSASNKLVVCNSELLRFYGSFDPRVRPIIILLRYWAKSLGLIKKSLLSSYAFCFMVIFALQNTSPPVLPSVSFLRKMAKYSYQVDGWETAFNKDYNLSGCRLPNTDTIENLLLHFFDFYWNFDFIQYVVCPFKGEPLSIKDIIESTDEKLSSFPVSTFSIQDPFILDRNISRNATMKTPFKLAILVARDLVQSKRLPLKTFFCHDYYQNCLNGMHSVNQDTNFISKNCEIFIINFTYDVFSKLGNNASCWYEKVGQAVYDLLQYGLLMECEIIEKTFAPKKPPKKKRKHITPSLIEGLELVISIQCVVYYDTWNSRKTVTEIKSTKSIKDDLCEALKIEHNVSRQLVPEPTVIKDPPIMFFQCDCYKYPYSQLSDMLIILRPTMDMGNLSFHGFGKSLRGFLTRTVEKILRET